MAIWPVDDPLPHEPDREFCVDCDCYEGDGTCANCAYVREAHGADDELPPVESYESEVQ